MSDQPEPVEPGESHRAHSADTFTYCRRCHKAWPCPEVSGVGELRRLVDALTDRVALLEHHQYDGSGS